MDKRGAFILLLVLLVPVPSPGQTQGEPPVPNDQTNLNEVWDDICAGIFNDPSRVEGELAFRCQEIFLGGIGTAKRANAATMGNNLGVAGAQGRTGRQRMEALTDVDLHSLNVFATVQSGWMDRKASVYENAFDSNVTGALVGLDYLFSETAVAGLTLAYSKVSVDFDAGAGDVDTKTLSVTTFQSHSFTDRLTFDTYLGVNAMDLESARHINYLVVLNEGQPNESTVQIMGTAQGRTKGHDVVGGAGLSVDASVGRLILSPKGRIDFLNRSISGYTEEDDVGMALTFEDQSLTSLTSSLGAELSLPMSKSWGSLVPGVNVDYVHEFRDDAREIVASFAQDPAAIPIAIQTQSPDRDFLLIGGSIVAVMQSGFALFMDFDAVTGHDFLDDQKVAVGFRAELQ
jgi:uncharacterized protein YhjY with autotransporter beta-barrel domain